MNEDTRLIIATHDGRQHADEVLACWFYSVLNGGNVRIIRTSDPSQLRAADVLLDCGAAYEPEKDRIDHHGSAVLPQPSGARVCGYATAGLVWRLHGRRICELILNDSREGPWLAYRETLTPEQVVNFYDMLVIVLDQEIVAPIDAWDLGIYPDRQLSKQLLPFQWILPHLEFETAMIALGRAFTHRLRTLAEAQACESNLEADLLNNGPSAFWVFGPWLIVKAPDGRRVELRAAKRFAQRTMNMPLMAVLSSLRGGSRWGAFLSVPLPPHVRIPDDMEFAAGRRSLFHNRPERLLEFLRQCESQNCLQVPAFCVESGHDHPS